VPTLAEHLVEARRNEHMADYVHEVFPNWSIVALF